MRRTAYMKALEEAHRLPTSIPELARYFKGVYNPQQEAVDYIKRLARLDVDGLYDCEVIEVLSYSPRPDAGVS